MNMLQKIVGRLKIKSRDLRRKSFSPVFNEELETRLNPSTMASKGVWMIMVDEIASTTNPADINIYASVYKSGKLLKGNIPVATDPALRETSPAIDVNNAGKIAISYTASSLTSDQANIRGYVYDPKQPFAPTTLTVASGIPLPATSKVSINDSGVTIVGYVDGSVSNLRVVQYAANGKKAATTDIRPGLFSPVIESVKIANNGTWAASFSGKPTSTATQSDVSLYAWQPAKKAGKLYSVANTVNDEKNSVILTVDPRTAKVQYGEKASTASVPIVRTKTIQIT